MIAGEEICNVDTQGTAVRAQAEVEGRGRRAGLVPCPQAGLAVG